MQDAPGVQPLPCLYTGVNGSVVVMAVVEQCSTLLVIMGSWNARRMHGKQEFERISRKWTSLWIAAILRGTGHQSKRTRRLGSTAELCDVILSKHLLRRQWLRRQRAGSAGGPSLPRPRDGS